MILRIVRRATVVPVRIPVLLTASMPTSPHYGHPWVQCIRKSTPPDIACAALFGPDRDRLRDSPPSPAARCTTVHHIWGWTFAANGPRCARRVVCDVVSPLAESGAGPGARR